MSALLVNGDVIVATCWALSMLWLFSMAFVMDRKTPKTGGRQW